MKRKLFLSYTFFFLKIVWKKVLKKVINNFLLMKMLEIYIASGVDTNYFALLVLIKIIGVINLLRIEDLAFGCDEGTVIILVRELFFIISLMRRRGVFNFLFLFLITIIY